MSAAVCCLPAAGYDSDGYDKVSWAPAGSGVATLGRGAVQVPQHRLAAAAADAHLCAVLAACITTTCWCSFLRMATTAAGTMPTATTATAMTPQVCGARVDRRLLLVFIHTA
jgi:hypothetical protein